MSYRVRWKTPGSKWRYGTVRPAWDGIGTALRKRYGIPAGSPVTWGVVNVSE